MVRLDSPARVEVQDRPDWDRDAEGVADGLPPFGHVPLDQAVAWTVAAYVGDVCIVRRDSSRAVLEPFPAPEVPVPDR